MVYNGSMSRVNIWKPTFLKVLQATCNVTEAASRAGVSRARVYKLRETSTKFRAQWKESEAIATDILAMEVRRRAMTGVKEPVYYLGKVVGHIQKPSDTLAIFLLKAHRPEMYRDNFSIDHKGAVDVNLKTDEDALLAKLTAMGDAASKDESEHGG